VYNHVYALIKCLHAGFCFFPSWRVVVVVMVVVLGVGGVQIHEKLYFTY
jgi:hypothetical protein